MTLDEQIEAARANSLKPRVGTLLGGIYLVTEKDAEAIYLANQDRAEKYCRWRVEQVQDGTVAAL